MPSRAISVLCFTVLSVSSASAAAPEPSAVAIDLRELDDDAFARLEFLQLERTLVVRLVQDGFAVVPLATRIEAITVRFEFTDPTLVVEVSQLGWTMRQEVAVAERTQAQFHLEVVQKVAEMVRAAAGTFQSSPAPPASAPSPTPVPQNPATAVPRRPATTVGIRVGAAVRGDVDPALAARGERALGPARLTVTLGYVPAGNTDIDVNEWSAAAGIAYWHALAPRLDLHVGVQIGAVWHLYELRGVHASEGTRRRRGTIARPLALAEGAVYGWLTPDIALGLTTAVGAAPGRLIHLDTENRPLWQRSAVRFDAGIAALFGF